MAAESREKNQFDTATYVYWKNQIEQAKDCREKFDGKGRKIVSRYRGDDRLPTERRYNILYSNTDTLEPVVYAKTPKAEVRANDSKDIASRNGAEMIELAVNYCINNSSFDQKARKAVKDFLLPGMGVIRPKYKPLVIEDDELSEVVYEAVDFDYVYWEDFLFPDVSEWECMPWIAFRSYMTFDEAADMFGSDKANMLKYEPRASGDKQYKKRADDSALMQAEVWEIWDKYFEQQIFWSASMVNAPLDIQDDPLDLDGFFPVPKPLMSIETSDTMLPVPFYTMYEDQAIELDVINSRIYHMLDNMRRRGFYDAAIDELGNLSNMTDNTFWPVKNWTDFTAKGGFPGVMQAEDITGYANILTVLEQSRQQLLNDIFQLIGISDIRRAQTDPRETLGAQKMKSRYGTIRISTYQKKVAEYMRDLLRITGNMIITQFDAKTLSIITNMPLKTEMEKDESGQSTGKVKHVGTEDLLMNLREQEPINITVDIQTDSTILEDEEEDRVALTEAIQAMSKYVEIAPALAQGIGAEAAAKVGMEIIERFKLGRHIQQEVQDHLDEVLANPPEAQPSPEEVLAQAELQREAMRSEVEMQKIKLEAAIEAGKLQIQQQENMLKARELGIEAEFNQDRINIDALNTMIKAEATRAEARSKENEFVGV